MSLRSRLSLVALAVGILLVSCGGVINLPKPLITGISPATVQAQSTEFTLQVLGQGFAPSSQIEFNGVPRTTTVANTTTANTIFVNQQELTTLVTPCDVAVSGTVNITVFTPAPGGGTSDTAVLTITQPTLPVPEITAIMPTSVPAGASTANITILGTNFVGVAGCPNASAATVSVVTADGASQSSSTAYVSPTELTVELPASEIQTVGPLELAVLNPPPPNSNPAGGGLSNAVTLNVVNPTPVLKSIGPQSVQAGTTQQTSITASGSGFDSNSQVLVNGTGRTTTCATTGCSTSLTATLATSDLAEAGTYTVQVENPAPGGGMSQPLYFSVVPTALGQGLPELVDVSPDAEQANDGVSPPNEVGPSMDETGRYVAYASSSNNLLQTTTLIPPPIVNPLTNGTSNIFLRDTCLGVTSCTPRELLVNVGPDNVIANGASYSPVVSANGADIVAYVSLGTDLVSGLSFNGTTPQVFATNPCVQSTAGCVTTTGTPTPCISATGNCTVTTNLMSIGSDGASVGDGPSIEPSIDSAGRFVAFASTATNLISPPTSGAQEIYLRDTCFGQASTCVPTTYLVSAAAGGGPADGTSSEPVVVADAGGQFIAFTSTSTNLVSGATGAPEIYRVQMCIGITKGCTATSAQLISTPDGTTFADGASTEPAMSPDGRIIAFASTATVLGAASGGVQEIYERDTCQGAGTGCTPRNVPVSVSSAGAPGNALSENPSVSSTGQYVAFASLASNLVTTNVGGLENVYVRNSCVEQASTCVQSTVLISQSATDVPGNGASLNPVINSEGGTIVAFYSAASNLVANDVNGFPDIFLAFSTF